MFWKGIGKGRQWWLGWLVVFCFFFHFALLWHWEELGWLYEPFLFLPWLGKIARNAYILTGHSWVHSVTVAHIALPIFFKLLLILTIFCLVRDVKCLILWWFGDTLHYTALTQIFRLRKVCFLAKNVFFFKSDMKVLLLGWNLPWSTKKEGIRVKCAGSSITPEHVSADKIGCR